MRISIAELHSLGPAGATVINVGKHAGKLEIRGSIRYRPEALLAASHLALPIASDLPVVLYDQHDDAEALDEIAAKLRANGYSNVSILEGGFAAYAAADGATQEASTEQVIPPSKPDEVQTLR
jgi:3-mercaptopyruvate sulfurtransferase SseA